MQIAHVGSDEIETAASAFLHELRSVIAEFHAFLSREALTAYRYWFDVPNIRHLFLIGRESMVCRESSKGSSIGRKAQAFRGFT